jgi:hypothetical protein
MADAISLTSHPVCVEDFIDPASPNTVAQQVTYNVLGIGAVLVTPLVIAASDAAAATAGVIVGQLYVYTGGAYNILKIRET